MAVFRVAHEWGRFPHEVAALDIAELNLMNAWLEILAEAQEKAPR